MSEQQSVLTLTIEGEDMDEETLYEHSKALYGLLQDELEEGKVSFAESGKVVQGAKGEPIAIATMILSLLSSKSATKLINCFKNIFSRERCLKISITRKEGDREVAFTFDAKNIRDDYTKELLSNLLAMQ